MAAQIGTVRQGLATEARAGSRHRLVWVAIGLIAVATFFAGLYSRTMVRSTEVSRAEAEGIVGADLLRPSQPVTGPTIDGVFFIAIANDPLLGPAAEMNGPIKDQKKDIAGQVRRSWQITDRIGPAIEGKVLSLPKDHGQFDDRKLLVPNEATEDALRRIATAFSSQILVEAAAPDSDRCFRATCNAVRFDRFLERSPRPNLYAALSECGRRGILLSTIAQAAKSQAYTADQLKSLYGLIKPAPSTDLQLAQFFQGDFRDLTFPYLLYCGKHPGEIGKVDDSDRLDRDHDTVEVAGVFDSRATLKMVSDVVRENISNCGRPWLARDRSAFSRVETAAKALPQPPVLNLDAGLLNKAWTRAKYQMAMRAVPNALGLWLIDGECEMWTTTFEASYYRRASQEAVRLGLLIELYRKLHDDRLPADLSELAALSGRTPFPVDLYSGRDFGYSPTRKTFWSVGKDGVDDGGAGDPDRFGSGPDIVWSIR